MNEQLLIGRRNKVELLAPVGLRESTIVLIDGKYAGDFCTWSRVEARLRPLGITIPWYKKLAHSLFCVNITLN